VCRSGIRNNHGVADPDKAASNDFRVTTGAGQDTEAGHVDPVAGHQGANGVRGAGQPAVLQRGHRASGRRQDDPQDHLAAEPDSPPTQSFSTYGRVPDGVSIRRFGR
jgi:hypothetical protein